MISQFLKIIRAQPARLIAQFCEKTHEKYWRPQQKNIPPSANLSQILDFLSSSQIKKGDTLFLHSSWDSLANGSFTPVELIDAILEYLGSTGTLAMPAFPPEHLQVSGTFFDSKKIPSGGGLVTEIFRRYPGVLRSINLNHSVCAIGQNAEFLTESHQFSSTSWDENSPYYRLCEIQNAYVVGLGVGHRLKTATCLHCVESILENEIVFYKNLFKENVQYSYAENDKTIGLHSFRKRYGEIYTPRIAKYYSSEVLIEDTINGLDVYSIKADILINRAIELGRQGKTMYVWPLPFPWSFRRIR